MIRDLLRRLRRLQEPTQVEKRMRERYRVDSIKNRSTDGSRGSGDYLVSALADDSLR